VSPVLLRELRAAALFIRKALLELAKDRSVALEEFARTMISAEEMHADEVDKMLRKPGQLAPVSPRQP